jgi:hypothetical protein
MAGKTGLDDIGCLMLRAYKQMNNKYNIQILVSHLIVHVRACLHKSFVETRRLMCILPRGRAQQCREGGKGM